RTSSAARSEDRSCFRSAYRYSKAIFCPSMKPRSRSASRIPSERGNSLVGSPDDRYPIRGTFFGCCASAWMPKVMSTTHIAKLPRFRLFISSSEPSHFLPHGCACSVPEPGQNIHLPLSKKKQAGFKIVGLSRQCLVLVCADLTLNQRVRSSSLRRLIKICLRL